MYKTKNSDGNITENERYIDSMHRLGRIGMLGAILVMLGMPTILGLYFDSLPDIGQIFQAAFPLLIVFLPSNLFEVFSYTPILGSSVYLTMMTGEVMNLKLPVVNNVLKMMNVEPGTVESDIISSIVVSVASLVTTAIVAVGILLAIPLQPVLSLPAVKVASTNLFPAVLGALLVSALMTKNLGGDIRTRGRFKGMILPVAVVVLITYFDPQISAFLHLDKLLSQEGAGVIMSVFQGFVILLILPITYFNTKWLYKKNKIQVYLRDETPKK
jgi:hypothetical protein